MNATDVVIFDLDDTLYFEKEYVASGFEWIANLCSGILAKPEQEVFQVLMETFTSKDKSRVFNALLDTFPALKQHFSIDVLVEEYRKHKPKIKLNPGVQDLFELLLKRNARLGLITDGFLVAQQNKIQVLELNNWLEKIITTDSWGKDYWKPHERAFAFMENAFGRDHETRYWYIGDNPEKDFIAPNAMGWSTVRYRNSAQVRYLLDPPSRHHRAKYEAESYNDLLKLISEV